MQLLANFLPENSIHSDGTPSEINLKNINIHDLFHFLMSKNGEIIFTKFSYFITNVIYIFEKNDSTEIKKYGFLIHSKYVDILLQTEGAINNKNYLGETPLYLAVKYGHIEIVERLISAHADLSETLQLTAEKGLVEIFKYLVDSGADIHHKDSNGRSLLYFAAKSGNNELFNQILEYGLDPCAKDFDGKTVSHYVFAHGNLDMVKTLMEKRVDFFILDNNRKLPFQLIPKDNFSMILEAIIDQVELSLPKDEIEKFNLKSQLTTIFCPIGFCMIPFGEGRSLRYKNDYMGDETLYMNEYIDFYLKQKQREGGVAKSPITKKPFDNHRPDDRNHERFFILLEAAATKARLLEAGK